MKKIVDGRTEALRPELEQTVQGNRVLRRLRGRMSGGSSILGTPHLLLHASMFCVPDAEVLRCLPGNLS